VRASAPAGATAGTGTVCARRARVRHDAREIPDRVIAEELRGADAFGRLEASESTALTADPIDSRRDTIIGWNVSRMLAVA